METRSFNFSDNYSRPSKRGYCIIRTKGTSQNSLSLIETDAIIIGGGFGGCNSLYKLREQGLSVKLIEADSAFRGVWHWNRYLGARVDTEMPSYQLNIPARFPGDEELHRYFQHVGSVLRLGKDAFFNNIFTCVQYDAESCHWTVVTNTGLRATCKFLVAATGSSYKKHYPKYSGVRYAYRRIEPPAEV
ncbi:hypothetical protein N7465_003384 [Penicillium sp. CMV-2018d]|nr:hypothetical protein N7465_003384 [Penicillium sp. CMV-2018d]